MFVYLMLNEIKWYTPIIPAFQGHVRLHSKTLSQKTNNKKNFKSAVWTWCQQLTSVILAIQEEEIRRIAVRRQSGQIVWETVSRKKPFTKKGLVEWFKPTLEFKPQYCKKKKCYTKVGYSGYCVMCAYILKTVIVSLVFSSFSMKPVKGITLVRSYDYLLFK
jgi:hypothetical protein